ncbi:MFS transporter [Sulfurospirillum oryzae]|uniref:MFS transporter n=1 Tax=Sulfurospirillum oryzae TaxID=2976535 RepID=UPI0021E82950|nr:MFS transporter [Sulfurospirillum oryzae]
MIFFKISGFFFFYFVVTGVYVIFMPKILQMIGYSTPQIGAIFALAPLMRFFVPFFFLKHFELTQKVFYTALGGALFSILMFYPTINHFYLFMLPNMLLGACLGMILPYVETYAMEHLQKERFGRSRLFGSIGFMLTGIILAQHLEDYTNGLHYLLLGIALTACFAYFLTQNNPVFTTSSTTTEVPFSFLHVKYLWLSLFLMQVSFGAFYNFFTIYETEHGISLEGTSYLWAFGVICEIILFYFQAPLLRRFSLLSLVKLGVFATALRWFLLFLFPSSLFISYATQSLHAFSFALHHTAALSLLYTLYAHKKLAAQFYYGFSFGLGGFVGALLAGYFYGEYLYLYASFIALLSLRSLMLFKGRE